MSISIAVVTALVAIWVAWINYSQWKTNREKLRLDLYDRRFQIYLRVLAFYQQIIVWDDRQDQVALQELFFAAFRESQFMFPPKSRVFDLLSEFHRRSYFVVKFTEARKALDGMPQEQMDLFNKRTDNVNWLLESMSNIEKGMMPYLSFHDL